MNTKNLQRKIKNIGLVLSLVFGFLVLSGVTANAQNRDDDDYYRNQQRDRRDDRRDRREDRNDQRGDRRRHRDSDDNNNNGNYGNNNGYYGNNNGGYNNGYGNNVYRVAQQYGYQDGYNKGLEDANEGHYNPQNTRVYKNALNGYDSRYGSRQAYQQAYRQAFLQGFDRAYNEQNGNNGYGNRRRRGY